MMRYLEWLKALLVFVSEVLRSNDDDDSRSALQKRVMRYSAVAIIMGLMVGLTMGILTRPEKVTNEVVNRSDEYEEQLVIPAKTKPDPPDRDKEAYERLKRLYDSEDNNG